MQHRLPDSQFYTANSGTSHPRSSSQLRASVLNAALDLGFNNDSFAKFMAGTIEEEPDTGDDVRLL